MDQFDGKRNALETDALIEKTENGVSIRIEASTKQKARESSREVIGYTLMAISSLFFSILWLTTRIATAYGALGANSVTFLRGMVQSSLGMSVAFTLLDYRTVFQLDGYLWRMTALRGILGAIALGTQFKCISLLPLPIASTFYFLCPAFAMILSRIFIGERTSRVEIGATVISFIGVVLVSDPWHAASLSNLGAQRWMLGIALGLLSALSGAGSFVALRAIAHDISFMTSVLSQGICVCILGLMLGGGQPSILSSNWYSTFVAILGCTAGFLGQCCMSKGQQYCRAGTGALMRNLNLPIVYLLSIYILHEMPRLVGVIGSGLVVLGSVILGLAALHDSIRNPCSSGER